ncbi:MAG: hypothetical protein IH977_07530 [Nitrospinae bacterium]|nr:hypothetical protein [Nitrospinota bacterium]
MKSWKTPTPDQVERAVSLISRKEQYRYFFDQLENPNWISSLKEKGFFSHPAPVVRDEEKGTIGFPTWPESRYLARMATKAPGIVLDISLQIDTDNVRVQEDIIDTALNMPPKYSAKLVPTAISWLGKYFHYSLLPRKLSELVKHLLEGNEAESGFQLAEKILTVRPDPRAEQKASQEKGAYRIPPEPISPFGAWEFKEILQKITSPLVTSDGNRTISLLCDRLETAVRLSKLRDEDQAPEDYSYIWRGAIDSAEDHYSEDVNNILVTALKEAAQEFLKRDPTVLPSLVAHLEGRKWVIFHRLALHLLLNFGHSFLELVSQRLTRRSLFEDRSFEREYRMLTRQYFRSLRPPDQDVIFQWIDTGPDLEAFVKFRKEYWDEETPDVIKVRYKKSWQRDHLFPFYADLSQDRRHSYDSLVQELGEPEPLESINMSSATHRGPVSPKTPDDLGRMTNTELISFLKTWESPNDPFGPDANGLSRQISSLVASDPDRFVSDLSHFQELDEPTYIRGILDGISEAKKDKAFDWTPVLNFCYWVVKKPVKIDGRHVKRREADPGWGWSRQTIGRLISSGLQEGNNPLPFGLREQVWDILWFLTEDITSPGPEKETNEFDIARDPITYAINTTRGEAIRLVVAYGLWVRRHLESRPNGEQLLANGFEEMPEAKKVLEDHLNPEIDSSLAIRAVYGQWLPWLVLLDSNWTKENLHRIFPRNDTLKKFRQVAWQTYIVFCSPYDNVFDLIKDEYAWASSELGSDEENRNRFGKPDEHLAQHLMAFYWRGKIDLNVPANLLPVFYHQASDIVCADVIEFGGRSLKNTEGEVPSDILHRFKRLWEYRFEAIASDNSASSHPKELSAFGRWFGSKKFNLEWVMTQLLCVLRLTQKIEPDHLVIEYLVETANNMPRETIECLALMIEGDIEGWHVHIWEKEIRAILTSVKQTGNLETQQSADNLINKLGAKGYFSYRDLLEIRPTLS